ncbi:hypothetical protein [Yersinia alsatica]|uniref:hypothetical protein n=1 Tax=Yersinia alsatica TaxID=2890317 RepID=UPI00119F5CCA|nr:hypothetical protein [Yersinia alsatica]
MEWFILDVICNKKTSEKVFAVRASEDIRFIIHVSTKATAVAGDILTPVIDGYILNKDRKLTVKINRVEPFTMNDWIKLRGRAFRRSAAS